ncbi:unnamed protein product [Lupinus luteus]|uniref:Secreted protein n=1 Tax=Lupinus luteus TaxID=3873 RepID=A0AAV1Y417_LUPLU
MHKNAMVMFGVEVWWLAVRWCGGASVRDGGFVVVRWFSSVRWCSSVWWCNGGNCYVEVMVLKKFMVFRDEQVNGDEKEGGYQNPS